MRSKFSVNPAWPQVLGLLSIAVALLAGGGPIYLPRCVATYYYADPLRCNALLTSGSWQDLGHKNWQPEGCMLHPYGAKDGATCLATRDIAFVGDSVTRKLFFQFAHLLDPSLPTSPKKDDQKHQDHELRTANGTRISFYWDPFLNGTYITTILGPTPSNHERHPPALLALGSGLWYLRYAKASGGIPGWGANIENIFNKLSDPSRMAADSIVMLPVEEVVANKLSPERGLTMHSSDIDAMNSDLLHRAAQHALLSGPSAVHIPMVFNSMLDPSATEDGIHFNDLVVQKQANILLNLRCNDELPKRLPYSKTCCNGYPWPNLIHTILLVGMVISIPVLCYLTAGPFADLRTIFGAALSPSVLPYIILSAGLALIYLSDRSWLWLKEQKQFNPWTFTFLCLATVLVGLGTLKRADNDQGFLNRDQTDEWKGWMQLIILIYHYLGASKVSGIYNPIRVLVASYLFMTGYGHTTFYLRKADFGFKRIAQVLVRLNLLTLCLAYIMDTDFVFYYFSPLVSWWYLIIYATMALGPRLNTRTPLLLLKVFFSAALTTYFMWQPRLLESCFYMLQAIFGINWSAREWAFRVNLDLWIVYVGMLASIFVVKAREHRLTDHHLWPLASKVGIAGSVLVLVWFFAFELWQESKFTYNLWHPYISFLPVLAFAILRNASTVLRSVSSTAFAFVGKCSLETFIIQYHFWLAGDTKGVLLVLPGSRWRPVNFVLTSIMFLYLSDRMAWATTQITTRICNEGQTQPSLPNPVSTAPRIIVSTPGQIGSEYIQEVELPSRASPDLSSKEGQDVLAEPDTPIRPRRWLDRLAEQPSSSPSSSKQSALSSVFTDLRGRVLFGLLVMWALNLLWVYT
ncbi:O-acetyltransferase [Coprinopsis sp. MPI-PUGE-AT-0042]|nr:O-acetyltransferase [Coprinopsis sp. MPI-PUGE-AT-0042]